jgi:hypothetical protein
VNSCKVLPNNVRVLLVPDMWELRRFNSESDFGAGDTLFLQEGFDSFGVGSRGWQSVSTTHNTKKIFLFQKSFHLDLPVIVVRLVELVKR